MRDLLLDAEMIHTRDELHDILAATFSFPEWYGRNLDAVYDLLTCCNDTRLTLVHAEMLVTNLGNYGELILRVLADASAENPGFILSAE